MQARLKPTKADEGSLVTLHYSPGTYADTPD
ncbi:MAG: hypothetical protein ACI8VC_001409 [Candidatus Endobugula sp.]|jgi:hypothetical protein